MRAGARGWIGAVARLGILSQGCGGARKVPSLASDGTHLYFTTNDAVYALEI